MRQPKPQASLRQSVSLPKALPEWLVKASWAATSLLLRIPAKTELDAWDSAWRKVSKMQGGMCCETIKVVRQVS